MLFPGAPKPRRGLQPIFLFFPPRPPPEASLHRHDLLNHSPMVVEFSLQPRLNHQPLVSGFLNLYFNFGSAGSSLLCASFLQLWRSGATLCCGMPVSHRVVSLIAEHGLQDVRASVVVVHGLSCTAAYAVFPNQGLNPCRLRWQAVSYPLHHQGSPLVSDLTPSPFLFSRGWRVGLKGPVSNHVIGSPGHQHLSLVLSRSHVINMAKEILAALLT